MLEIVLLVFVGKYLVALLRRRGRKPAAWIAALILGWIGCEIIVGVAAAEIFFVVTQKPPDLLVIIPFMWLGGGAFGWVLCRMARALPLEISAEEASVPPPLPGSMGSAEPEVELPMVGWFLAIAGKKSGPFSLYQVREKYQRGEISDETLYWLPEEKDWQPVARIARHFAGH